MWWWIVALLQCVVWRGEDNLKVGFPSLYHVVPEIILGLAWLKAPLLQSPMGSFLSQVFQTPFSGGPWIAVAECRQATLDRRIWIICTAGSKCSAGCWWWEFLWPLDPLMTSSDTFPEYSLTGKGPQLLFILNIQVPQTVTNACIDRDGGRVFRFSLHTLESSQHFEQHIYLMSITFIQCLLTPDAIW